MRNLKHLWVLQKILTQQPKCNKAWEMWFTFWGGRWLVAEVHNYSKRNKLIEGLNSKFHTDAAGMAFSCNEILALRISQS